MARIDQLTLKQQVWDALTQTKGDRDLAAQKIGKSVRTLNRYIAELDLYEEMDKAGMMRNAGPPRGPRDPGAPRESNRQKAVVSHIKAHNGEIDYGELATEMYGADNPKTRSRTYVAVTELTEKGAIANDGQRWFVL